MQHARRLGTLFRSMHQRPVVGEIIAGIVLGPSVLGRLAPGVSAYVLPGSVAPFLNVISQVGVILYMFLVGLELRSDAAEASPTSQPTRIEQTSDEPAHVDPSSIPALRAQDAATGVR